MEPCVCFRLLIFTPLWSFGLHHDWNRRSVTSLGHQRGRRNVWEGPKFLNVFNTFFQGVFATLRPPAPMVAIRWGTRGTCPPTFFRRWGYNIPCHPNFFLYVLYLKRFQNKSDICHVLCEELFIRPRGKNLAEGDHWLP